VIRFKLLRIPHLQHLAGVTDIPLSRGGAKASGSKEDVEKLAAQLSSHIPLGRIACVQILQIP
jgi:hypothetical protein